MNAINSKVLPTTTQAHRALFGAIRNCGAMWRRGSTRWRSTTSGCRGSRGVPRGPARPRRARASSSSMSAMANCSWTMPGMVEARTAWGERAADRAVRRIASGPHRASWCASTPPTGCASRSTTRNWSTPSPSTTAATTATRAAIITFIGASGGAGATTLALSAAEYLARKSTERRDRDLPGRPRFPARQLQLLSQPLQRVRPERRHQPAGTARRRADGHHQADAQPRLHALFVRAAASCRSSRRARISSSSCSTSSPIASTMSSSTCRTSRRPGTIPCCRPATRSSSCSSSTSSRCGMPSSSTRRSASCAAARSASRWSPTSTSASWFGNHFSRSELREDIQGAAHQVGRPRRRASDRCGQPGDAA